MQNEFPSVVQPGRNLERRELVVELKARPPNEAATLLNAMDAGLAFEALSELNPSFTQDILTALPAARRQEIFQRQWPCLRR